MSSSTTTPWAAQRCTCSQADQRQPRPSAHRPTAASAGAPGRRRRLSSCHRPCAPGCRGPCALRRERESGGVGAEGGHRLHSALAQAGLCCALRAACCARTKRGSTAPHAATSPTPSGTTGTGQPLAPPPPPPLRRRTATQPADCRERQPARTPIRGGGSGGAERSRLAMNSSLYASAQVGCAAQIIRAGSSDDVCDDDATLDRDTAQALAAHR
jgi:hypothetical protein